MLDKVKEVTVSGLTVSEAVLGAAVIGTAMSCTCQVCMPLEHADPPVVLEAVFPSAMARTAPAGSMCADPDWFSFPLRMHACSVQAPCCRLIKDCPVVPAHCTRVWTVLWRATRSSALDVCILLPCA